MGVTPLEGLVMATRCGDIDPAIPKILSDLKGLSLKEVDALMNKQSGLLGVAGDKDMRSVVEGAAAGEERAQLALDVFVHRVRKYLGAYYVHLGESEGIYQMNRYKTSLCFRQNRNNKRPFQGAVRGCGNECVGGSSCRVGKNRVGVIIFLPSLDLFSSLMQEARWTQSCSQQA